MRFGIPRWCWKIITLTMTLPLIIHMLASTRRCFLLSPRTLLWIISTPRWWFMMMTLYSQPTFILPWVYPRMTIRRRPITMETEIAMVGRETSTLEVITMGSIWEFTKRWIQSCCGGLRTDLEIVYSPYLFRAAFRHGMILLVGRLFRRPGELVHSISSSMPYAHAPASLQLVVHLSICFANLYSFITPSALPANFCWTLSLFWFAGRHAGLVPDCRTMFSIHFSDHVLLHTSRFSSLPLVGNLIYSFFVFSSWSFNLDAFPRRHPIYLYHCFPSLATWSPVLLSISIAFLRLNTVQIRYTFHTHTHFAVVLLVFLSCNLHKSLQFVIVRLYRYAKGFRLSPTINFRVCAVLHG